MGCPVLTVGGAADHVHVLCNLSRNLPISKVVRDLKRESSKWVKSEHGVLEKFAWQNGYGVFSVGQSEIDRVRKYIVTQENHHRKRTFQNEFREFLTEYNIDYDERYVWD
jgi:REP element-mobilizing transposase RayT